MSDRHGDEREDPSDGEGHSPGEPVERRDAEPQSPGGPVEGTDGAGTPPEEPPGDGDVARASSGSGQRSDDSPLGDLARRVEDRPTGGDEVFERAFESVETAPLDGEDAWSRLADDRIAETVADPESDADRAVHVVPKREFCRRCQYFAAPPAVECTYDGATIQALEDVAHFRVADCPVVRGDEDLRDARR